MVSMDTDPDSRIKHREILFCTLRPDDQAKAASLLLNGVEGVLYARPVGDTQLLVGYDIRHVTLNIIDDALTELGFHLANHLMAKFKRALYYYTEETQRQNMGLEQCNTGVHVFIQRYQRLQHGCRDGRPEYWRKYQ